MKVKMQNSLTVIWIVVFFLASCQSKEEVSPVADLILYNAYVYPVKGSPIDTGAVVIRYSKIIAVGNSNEIMKEWKEYSTEKKDCQGAFLMPGFIEGHGHFSSLGYNLINVNLLNTKSWEEIVDSVAARVKNAKPGEWIFGRGWHQEKWSHTPDQNVNGYPYHQLLSSISPDNPVLLSHASGHALFANEAAMKASGVTSESPDPQGGHILRDAAGVALGVFEERAMEIIQTAYNEYQRSIPKDEFLREWYKAIRLAQEECLQYGITTFEDAGSTFEEIKRYKKMAEEDSFNLRLWAMLRHPYDTLKGRMNGFPIINAGDHSFTCRAIKSETDGALGSYGAWLLAPYDDKPGFTGQNTTLVEDVKGIAQLAMDHDMQLCVHSIGDKGNRVTLDIMEETFQSHPDKKDLRWRIEHAQHLNPVDIPRFKSLGIIASMQGIHCTSDAPFVVKRLGETRAKEGAYAWRSLLESGAIIANGTDAPVESVNPIPCIYATVTRKRLDTGMEFFPEQKMTREEALYSYTLANAYAAFEDELKGSIEVGKLADIILVSKNLIKCKDDEIPEAYVLMTMVGGIEKYKNKE
ncbi:MAG: amidohydrolase [Bacteroidota bacterium]|nr:amidohydrolase [Bacteroidota bacterium]